MTNGVEKKKQSDYQKEDTRQRRIQLGSNVIEEHDP